MLLGNWSGEQKGRWLFFPQNFRLLWGIAILKWKGSDRLEDPPVQPLPWEPSFWAGPESHFPGSPQLCPSAQHKDWDQAECCHACPWDLLCISKLHDLSFSKLAQAMEFIFDALGHTE